MKKILSLAIVLAGVSLCADAQKKLPADPYPTESSRALELVREARPMGQAPRVNAEAKAAAKAPVRTMPAARMEANEETTPYIGYKNPKGTLFLGMDEAANGFFFQYPGVVGGWSDSIECWVWPNEQKGYKSIRYLNPFSEEYSQYEESEYYWIDKDGNFCDALVADGGMEYYKDLDGDYSAYIKKNYSQYAYSWQLGIPLQIIHTNDNVEKKFVLLSSSADPSIDDCGIAAGGLPSMNTADGLWPLTNAVSTTTEGISANLIRYKAADDYVQYFFGASKLTLDSGMVYNPSTGKEEMEYTRIMPVELTTTYDKPQTPLYIKNITIAVSSEKYSAFKPKELQFDTLFLTISTMEGKELATSFATNANSKHITIGKQKGRLVAFPLLRDTTAYGELLHEGLLIDEAFKISIKGFKETDKLGFISAKCIIHPTHAQMLYEGGVVREYPYEPYIMLNGIYPTLEDFYAMNRAGTGQVGDTIPIKMVPIEKGKYNYKAIYAHWGNDNDEFAIRSTFTPYDSIARTWNMDIETPEYATVYADYEFNIGTEDDPNTIWEYYRLFLMRIYVSGEPVLGDYIKIGKAGKYLYFRIDAIDTVDDAFEIPGSSSQDGARRAEKVLQDGRLLIRKDGKMYNLYGIQQ